MEETACRLNVCCPEQLAAAREFAKEVKAEESFEEQLKTLQAIGTNMKGDEVILTSDLAPYGFNWAIMRDGTCVYNGGLLFSAPGDWGGGAPNFSVNVDAVEKPEWRIHS